MAAPSLELDRALVGPELSEELMAKALAVGPSGSKKLTAAQAERKRAVLSSARKLAKQSGGTEVSLSAIAKDAGVSRATIYHYFGSKELLLIELTVLEVEELHAVFERRSRVVGTPDERLAAVLIQIVDWALLKPTLFRTLAEAWTSDDFGQLASQHVFGETIIKFVDMALTQEDGCNREEIARVVGHVLYSCLLRMKAEVISRDEAAADLRLTAHLLVGDRLGEKIE
ncbi:MAG: AcrR family transcriptional regulator [Myxococcota bacterium]